MTVESVLPVVFLLLLVAVIATLYFLGRYIYLKSRPAVILNTSPSAKANVAAIPPKPQLSLLSRSKVVAVYNIKGGVGKTTSAVNIAYHLSQQGHKTLFWDMDAQGSASFFFDMELGIKGGVSAAVEDMHTVPKAREILDCVAQTPYENLYLLPADTSFRLLDIKVASAQLANQFIKQFLSPFRDEYDYIIVDCPPSLTVSVESMLNVSNLIVVPTIPTTLSVRMLDELVEFVNTEIPSKPAILAFFSMMNEQKAMHKEIFAQLCSERKKIMSPIVVPYAAEVERMGIEKAPIATYAPSSRAVEAYNELVKRITVSSSRKVA